jgi:uncharacterized protein YfbU (UPF0304 family)
MNLIICAEVNNLCEDMLSKIEAMTMRDEAVVEHFKKAVNRIKKSISSAVKPLAHEITSLYESDCNQIVYVRQIENDIRNIWKKWKISDGINYRLA